MKCKDCKFFTKDVEFPQLGQCSKIFNEYIHVVSADAWYIEPEFGCIYGEPRRK